MTATKTETRIARIRREHAFVALDAIRKSGEFNMLTDARAIAEQLVWDDLAQTEAEGREFLSLWRQSKR